MKEKTRLARHKICSNCKVEFCDQNPYYSRKTCSKECASALSGLSRRGIPKSDKHKNKISETCKDHYQNKTGFVATNLEKYGVENPFQVPEVQQKIQETCLNTYGVPFWAQTDEAIQMVTANNRVRKVSDETRALHRSNAQLQMKSSGLNSRGKEGFRSDLGTFFRSSWEANFARILNYMKLTWEFEPVTFELHDDVYTPDFRINRVFYEIKGWWDDRSKRKTIKFLEQFPSQPLVIVGPKEYKNLKKIFEDKIEGWE